MGYYSLKKKYKRQKRDRAQKRDQAEKRFMWFAQIAIAPLLLIILLLLWVYGI